MSKNNYETRKLKICMSYIYNGITEIDVPASLLEGKSEKEQLEVAYDYAQENIDSIPVSDNPEYVMMSDNFEEEDIWWEED